MASKAVVSLRQRALNLLSRREHSRLELHYKLSAYAEERDDLDALLLDFQQRGWLSDERFAEQYVYAHKSRYGKLKMEYELREKGVAEDLVEQALAGLDELENARTVWQKKFSDLPHDQADWVRQAKFLQGRGFGFEVIKKVLGKR